MVCVKDYEQYTTFYRGSDSYPKGLGEDLIKICWHQLDGPSQYLYEALLDHDLEGEDTSGFDINYMADTLFCEYFYLIDVQKAKLSFFVGYQTEPVPYHEIYNQTEHLRKCYENGEEVELPQRMATFYPCRFIGSININYDYTQDYLSDQMHSLFLAYHSDAKKKKEEAKKLLMN